MSEKLIFIKKVDDNLYQFDFSNDVDTAWGEGWNVAPAANHPNIVPEVNAVSSSYRVANHPDMDLACTNTCFSMQDCIDGILPLGFTEPEDEKRIEYNFGLDLDNIFDIWHLFKCKPEKLKLDDGNDIIQGLINDLNDENNGE